MKKIFQRLFTKLLLAAGGAPPPPTTCETTALLCEAVRLKEDTERELRLTQIEYDKLAATVAQLRVHGMHEHGRTGYGVTMFIPEDVLATLRSSGTKAVIEFVDAVAHDLVGRAVRGLYYRNRDNKVSVMLFEDAAGPKAGQVHGIYLDSANKAPVIATKQAAFVVTEDDKKLALEERTAPVPSIWTP